VLKTVRLRVSFDVELAGVCFACLPEAALHKRAYLLKFMKHADGSAAVRQ
jgi:hypothetical protein